MHSRLFPRRTRILAVAAGSVAALAVATVAPAVGGTTGPAPAPAPGSRVVVSGLDNPRQLSVAGNGDLIVAEAGHGSSNPDNCVGSGEDTTCIGRSGKVTRIHNGHVRTVMRGLLSAAGGDGTFAVGADGAGKRPGGPFYAIITEAPPDVIPEGMPGRQSGRLLAQAPGGKLRFVANIAKFEARRDVDNEGVESNPYSLLALRDQVLVADAAGDYIASVKHGKVSVWAKLPEYGKRVDAVPTVISKGEDGKVYVGELHSEQPGKARVWQYNRNGHALRSWRGFTTVTGVARGADGSLYVSELFGGSCGFDEIPDCFPGRVVKIDPDGDRHYRKVPFPAGVAVHHGQVHVVAFSIAPATGALGNPSWNGQVWRIFR